MRSLPIYFAALVAFAPPVAASTPSGDAEIIAPIPRPEKTRPKRCFQVTAVKRFEIDEAGAMREIGGFKLIEECK